MYHQTVKSIVIEDSVVDPFSGGMLVIDLLISFCAARAGMGIGGRVISGDSEETGRYYAPHPAV